MDATQFQELLEALNKLNKIHNATISENCLNQFQQINPRTIVNLFHFSKILIFLQTILKYTKKDLKTI